MPARAWWYACVALVAAAVAHSCGYLFAVGNQVTYFIEPLRRAHPELFRGDWFAHQTSYHRVFAATASWIYSIEDTGAVGAALVHVVLMIALIVAVAAIANALRTHSFAVFALVVAWLTISGDRSMAGSYLWSGYLQPSLIASVGWMVALAAHVRGRMLLAGLALAAGGVFHANFLVLGLGMFALAELVNGTTKARLAALLVPQLAALAVVLPDLLRSAHGEDPQLALWVLVRFHAPLHYHAWSIVQTAPRLIRWVALAVVAAPVAAEVGRSVTVRRLVTWTWLAGALCLIVLGACMLPPLAGLTRLYVWRLAPFAQAGAMFVIALAAIATIADPGRWRDQPWWRRIGALGLSAWLVASVPHEVGGHGGWVIAVIAAAIVLAVVVPQLATMLPLLAGVASLAVVLGARWDVIAHPEVAINSQGFEADDLFAWAQTTTPTDAVFLTPPSLGRFRMLARRAIIVDFKSPPLVPDELVAWYRRLCDVTGNPRLHDVPQANALWAGATREELLARAKRLGAHYLVLDRPHDPADPAAVYSNASYVVYPVP